MKVFFIVAGAVIIIGGLLVLIASPIGGIFFLLLGAAFLIFGIRHKKEPAVTSGHEPNQSSQVVTEYMRHTILVAGFDHHQDALKSLLTELNPFYDSSKAELMDELYGDERIYQYEKAAYPLHIQAEPDNPYDSNAVKVLAGDTFVGYVPRGAFSEIKECMSHNPRTSVEIFGGKYKYLDYDSDEDYLGTGDSKYYTIKTDSTPVKAVMVFTWDTETL